MITTHIKSLIFIFAVNVSILGQAQTITIPVSQQQPDNTIELPKKHQTMSSVSEQFGQPLEKKPPMGKPPITRWQYQEFIVVFEHQHVIHAVTIHRPKHPTTTNDERQP
ncbi:hypothetical protein SIN8267_00073 [Sinobacterium norvegicum]|uniref:Phosphodiesterase n=1 Tax=Sinobacterium norvegicum TaxID=1641715 RepID=A0ABM9AA03_9GAMM|nr:hypothetical protein [Sinobacterium norvegicum]CAH0989996.1 hypothetical protein SIN8267_00073 [Sinobacterium norvegicum]